MRRIALAVALALGGLVTASAPAVSAEPTCTTYTYRSERPSGFSTLVRIRRTTLCYSEAGYLVGIKVTVRRYRIPR